MPAPSPLAPFLEPLERLGLPYCVTGSAAARDPLHAWALAHRRRIELGDHGAWIAPPEYVILRKLEYLREGGQDKHVRDIRFVLAASKVDRAFVESEVARLGLNDQWWKCQPDH